MITVQMQTIDSCNAKYLACPHPRVYHTNETIRNHLFEKIVNDFVNHFDQILFALFLENEPLLDKYLFERIKYIKNLQPNAVIQIVTNGILLDKYKYDILEHVDLLSISLDGIDAETYNKVHKTKLQSEYWDKMINAIHFLENQPGIATTAFSYLPDVDFDEQYFSNKKYTRGGFLNHIEKVNHDKIYGCEKKSLEKHFNILADGSLILCCMDYLKNPVVGHFEHQNLNEILNSSIYKTVVKKINGEIESSDNFICKMCERAITYS